MHFNRYLPAVGQIRFLASQEVFGLSDLASCKTWKYKGHLNGGAACCRLHGQLYSGETPGSLMIKLLIGEREQASWGDWHHL